MVGLILKTMPERCEKCPCVEIDEGLTHDLHVAQFAKCYPVFNGSNGKDGRIGTYPVTQDSPPVPQIERPDWCPLVDLAKVPKDKIPMLMDDVEGAGNN